MRLSRTFVPVVYLSKEFGSGWKDFPHKGSFTNYVDKFLAFFDLLPPFDYSFYLIKIDILGLPTNFFS